MLGWVLEIVPKIHNHDSHEMAELILIYMNTVLKRLGKTKTSCSVFYFQFCDVAKLAIIQKEDLVKSSYRLDIKIKKFKNDDQSGPIFFLKNPLCVCVRENYIFQVEKCKNLPKRNHCFLSLFSENFRFFEVFEPVVLRF